MPVNIEADNEYYIVLKEKLNRYVTDIENINRISENSIEKTKQNVKSIIESVELYYNADISGAKDKIQGILKNYMEEKFIVSELDKSYAFRELAPFIDSLIDDSLDIYIDNYRRMNSGELSFFKARIGDSKFKKEDMLHIPFSKRELVSTQRFSIPGVPCLYLGSTSYVCWLEMNKPQDSFFNVSSYRLPKELKILNLVIDQTLINNQVKMIDNISQSKKDINIELLQKIIEIFPLVYATSFSINNKDRSFKSEYIISQLIMQCLSELNIDGVAYVSKKVNDSYIAFPQCINLAIPAKANKKFIFENKSDYYGDICRDIELTDPVNLSEFTKMGGNNTFTFYDTYINILYNLDGTCWSKVNLGGQYIDYKWTEFSKFDRYIYNLKHENVKIFNND